MGIVILGGIILLVLTVVIGLLYVGAAHVVFSRWGSFLIPLFMIIIPIILILREACSK